MIYRIAADAVAMLHLGFILFVVFGGFLALRWRILVWFHIPAAVWGFAIEITGWICPLTPLENALRMAGDGSGYSGGFIEQYIVPLIYPAALTRGTQHLLAAMVALVNVVAYVCLLNRRSRRRTRDL